MRKNDRNNPSKAKGADNSKLSSEKKEDLSQHIKKNVPGNLDIYSHNIGVKANRALFMWAAERGKLSSQSILSKSDELRFLTELAHDRPAEKEPTTSIGSPGSSSGE